MITPWISFAGVGGLERIYRLQGLGATVGDHTLTAVVYGNGDGSTVLTTKAVSLTAGPTWPWELRPAVQKLTSMKIKLTETFTFGGTAGPSIVGLALVAGVKVGLRKLYAPTARLT